MTDDTTDDTTVRVTYAELAAARGVSVAAARRLTLRHRWQKQIGNDGLTRVVVPVAFMETDATTVAPTVATLDEMAIAAVATATAKATTVAVTDALTDVLAVVPILQEAITSLRVELFAERDRANAAEKRVRELEARRWWQRR